MTPRLSLAGLAILGAVLLLSCSDSDDSTTATETATAPRPDDLFWAIRPRGIFADERVTMAFGHLVDGQAAIEAAGVASSRTLHFSDPPPVESRSEERGRELLLAAGIDVERAPFVVDHQCTIGAAGGAPDWEAVAIALGQQVAAALTTLGTTIEPCTLAEPGAEGDLLLWPFGFNSQALAMLPEPDVPGFIGR